MTIMEKKKNGWWRGELKGRVGELGRFLHCDIFYDYDHDYCFYGYYCYFSHDGDYTKLYYIILYYIYISSHSMFLLTP